MKLIAFTGLGGAIGQRLLAKIPLEYSVLDLYHTKPSIVSENVTSQKIDLLNLHELDSIFSRHRPDALVNLAAITHIDRCEQEQGDESGDVWRVNVDAPHALAKISNRNKIPFLFMSTECVFNGSKVASEKTTPDPINWYGVTKYEAEQRVLEVHKRAIILRSVVAYHENDNQKTPYGKLEASLRRGEITKMVSDHFFSPTYTDDIVTAIFKLVGAPYDGVFHVAPPESVTPFDFGIKVANHLGVDSHLVKACSGLEYFGRQRNDLRLKYSVLDARKTAKILGFEARTIDQVFF